MTNASDLEAKAHASAKQFSAGPPQGKLAPLGGSEPHEVGSVGAYDLFMSFFAVLFALIIE